MFLTNRQIVIISAATSLLILISMFVLDGFSRVPVMARLLLTALAFVVCYLMMLVRR